MENIAKVYADLIKKGIKTIEGTPEHMRESVVNYLPKNDTERGVKNEVVE